MFLVAGAGTRSIGAAPAIPASAVEGRAAPSWMRSETASRLAQEFPVLVPEAVPAPFDVEPAVNAWPGHYDLYWVVVGGEPTFLEITGEAGGDIPDFSWYDRNVELTINADVGGVPAYRDLTPIYDNVYWQVDDVVYTVSSQRLEGATSLSVANALVRLEPSTPDPMTDPPSLTVPETVSSGKVVDISVTAGDGATLSAEAGAFVATGDGTYPGVTNETVGWAAPDVESELAVTFTLTDPDTGAWLAAATTVVLAPARPTVPLALGCPVSVTSGASITIIASGGGDVVVEADTGTFPVAGANVGFDGAGTSRLLGTLPETGSVSLTWLAPESNGTGIGTLYLSGMSGAGGDSCTVQIVGSSSAPVSPEAPATDPSPTRSAARSTVASGDPATTRAAADPAGSIDSAGGSERPARATAEAADATAASGDGTAVGGMTGDEGASTSSRAGARGPRVRYPTSDGTGGVAYPRYTGDSTSPAPSGGNMILAAAPTNAPMPDALPTLVPDPGAAGAGPGSSGGSLGAVVAWLTILSTGAIALASSAGTARRKRMATRRR